MTRQSESFDLGWRQKLPKNNSQNIDQRLISWQERPLVHFLEITNENQGVILILFLAPPDLLII